MRICFFCHIAGLGGAERSLLQLVGDLVAWHGVECHVVCPGEGLLVEQLRAAGATVDIVPYRWWVKGPSDQAGWAAYLAPSASAVVDYVFERLRAAPPDLIVTHSIVTPWGAVAAALLARPHAWHVCEFPGGAFNLPFAPDDQLLVADIAASSNLVFMAGDLILLERLAAFGAPHVVVLPRFIAVPPPDPEFVSPFDIAGAMRLALCSSYNPLKGQLDAIQAVHLLTAEGRTIELVCGGPIGAPDWFNALRDYVATHALGARVKLFESPLNPYDTMRAAHVVLALGRREAFGRTALEGMLLAKPVIYAGDGFGFRYMRDEVTGLSYRPGDVRGLAALLRRLQDDAETARRLGGEAQSFADATFTRANFSERFFASCRTILSGNSGARPMPSQIAPVVEAALASTGQLMTTPGSGTDAA